MATLVIKSGTATKPEKNLTLRKGGPYIGPKGGKYADPEHKTAWKDAGGGKVVREGGIKKRTKKEAKALDKEKALQDAVSSAKPDSPEKAKAHRALAEHQHSIGEHQPAKFNESRAKLIEDKHKPMEKSMQFKDLDDWLQKSGTYAGLPSHEPGMGLPKSSAIEGGSAEGGELAGLGETSGSATNPAGPGQNAGTGVVTVAGMTTNKLSEDDAEDEANMQPHQKPIEQTVRKSCTPTDQREAVAHEHAQVVSRLRKGAADVYIGPNNHPMSLQKSFGDVEDETETLLKGSFYQGRSPSLGAVRSVIQSEILCKSVFPGGCDSSFSAALTACPDCGAGVVQHRHVPSAGSIGITLQKSDNDAPALRPRQQERDVFIAR